MEKKLDLLSEFIISKFKSKDHIIELCDCENFVILKGFSTDKEVLSIHGIIDEFRSKYEIDTLIKIIDLIEYKTEIKKPEKFSFFFGKNVFLKKSFFEVSNFPYGCSMSQGKLIYLYFKHIVDRIPSSYPFSWIKFEIEISERGEILFEIEDDYLNNENDILKSLILDCFDFDLIKFESIAKKMDLEKYILNPNEPTVLDEIEVKDFFLN